MFTAGLRYLQRNIKFSGMGDSCSIPRYIAVNPAEDPVRLFDRKTGKFLCQIGDIGQGPTEYPYAGNIQIEEDSNIVLISAKRPNRLIQYELSTGKYQKEYKLISPSLKKVYCDLKNREIIGIGYPYPTFDESIYNFWKQTFDGKMIQGITGIEQVGMSGHNRGSGYLDDRTNCYQVML